MINNILHNALIAITNNSDKFDWNTPLTFTALEPNSTITLTTTDKPVIDGLQYRTNINSDWSTYTIDTEIKLENVGDYVQFQNTNEQLSTSSYNYVKFVMSGTIAASGNIQSMLNYSYSCTPYCYYSMFEDCTSLTTAPELPATTLAKYCYKGMFYDCTSLVNVLELPATTLEYQCYASMFHGCSSLTVAPKLPATNLAESCYYQMFMYCTSLTVAPELPATNLANSCYAYMFIKCTSLTTAPELPATNLADRCYGDMFEDCTSLTSAPELPATTLVYYCYQSMFEGCTSLTVAPTLPATTLADGCYSRMFSGCSSLTTAPELPATTLATNCYRNMFSACISLNYVNVGFTAWNINNYSTSNWLLAISPTGTFVCPKKLDITKRGDDYIPEGWTVETY